MMIKTFKKIAVMGVLALAACTSQVQKTVNDITGKWDILSAKGVCTKDGEEQAFIQFDANGEMNGNTSVNSFFGSYTLEDGKLKLENIGMTRRMGANMEIEMAITEALNGIAGIVVEDSVATLTNESGEEIMTLKKSTVQE